MQRIQQWIAKRFQVNGTKTLLQKDVLVFIYKQGFLYLVLILITFIAGINYANNLILGFCFLISAILCISFYLTFKQLHVLQIDLIAAEVGQVDQPLILKLHFNQPSVMTRYLRIQWLQQEQLIYLYQQQNYFVPNELKEKLDALHYLIRNVANNINQITHRSHTLKVMVYENDLLMELKKLEDMVTEFTLQGIKK